MESILIIIGSASAGWLVAEGTGWVQTIKWYLQITRLKPFDCPLCLSFWIAFIYSFVTHPSVMTNLFTAAMSSVLAIYISKKLSS